METPDLVDTHELTGYLDKNMSVEGELQGLRKKLFSGDDVEECVQKAFNIKGNLFELRVPI